MKFTSDKQSLAKVAAATENDCRNKINKVVNGSHKKEAVLLLSDWDYDIWSWERISQNYDDAIFQMRMKSLASQAVMVAQQAGCDSLTIVNLGSFVYRPRCARVRSNYRETGGLVGGCRVYKSYHDNLVVPMMNDFNDGRFVFTPRLYVHSQTINSNVLLQRENDTNAVIARFIAETFDRRSQYTTFEAGDVYGTFRIFNWLVGITHGNGYNPDIALDKIYRECGYGIALPLDYALLGWNPYMEQYFSGPTHVITNGRLHHNSINEMRKKGLSVGDPHQKLFVFDEKRGLTSTYYLRVA